VTSPQSRTKINVDALLRMLAVLLVVFNHAAMFGPESKMNFGGGMTVLMMLSGLSFARFTLSASISDPVSLRSSIQKMIVALAVPMFIVDALYMTFKHKFSLGEFLFVSNLYTEDHIGPGPEWYIFCVIQILVGIYLSTFIKPLREAFEKRPLTWSTGIFAVSVAVAGVFPLIWNTSALENRLPHLLFWNFTLGWVVFYCQNSGPKFRILQKFLLIAATFAAGGIYWKFSAPNTYILTMSMLILLFVNDVYVPKLMKSFTLITNKALYYIFLLNYLGLFVYVHAIKLPFSLAAWVFATLFSIGIWAVFDAGGKALRMTRWPSREIEDGGLSIPEPVPVVLTGTLPVPQQGGKRQQDFAAG